PSPQEPGAPRDARSCPAYCFAHAGYRPAIVAYFPTGGRWLTTQLFAFIRESLSAGPSWMNGWLPCFELSSVSAKNWCLMVSRSPSSFLEDAISTTLSFVL